MSVIKEGLTLPANRNGKIEIPNCHRRMFPEFLKEMGYKVGVEIGVYKGHFTARLSRKGFKIYGIDPWLFHKEYHPHRIHRQVRQEQIYIGAKKRLAPFPNCTLIRKMSMDAVKDFKDNSIDFVYIDGHHGFKYVTEDIYEWSKKVRKGGIVSGHDYDLREGDDPLKPHVLQIRFVVDAYTKAFRIKEWYVLGREKKVKGEYREQSRSWFWFKK